MGNNGVSSGTSRESEGKTDASHIHHVEQISLLPTNAKINGLVFTVKVVEPKMQLRAYNCAF